MGPWGEGEKISPGPVSQSDGQRKAGKSYFEYLGAYGGTWPTFPHGSFGGNLGFSPGPWLRENVNGCAPAPLFCPTAGWDRARGGVPAGPWGREEFGIVAFKAKLGREGEESHTKAWGNRFIWVPPRGMG